MKKTSGKSQGRGDYLSLAIVISLLIGLILSSCARILELQELDKTKENSKNAQRGYSAGRFGSDNLVSNPSFESDLSGWEGWQSSLTRIALADAPDGDYVVRVTRTTGTSYTVDDNPATVDATVAGQTYWASAWVKAASTSSQGKSVTLRLREINSSGVLVKETISQAIPLATTFRQLFITAMAVASGNTLDIRISQSNAASGDSFYADQFILEPAPANNLVSNPSFETNTSGWIGWQSTLARTQLQGVDGDYVVKVTRSTGSSYTVNDEPPTVSSTTAGQTYDASAWVQAASTSAEGKTVTLKIREKNSAGELVQEISSPAIPLSNFFQQLSASITAQGNGNTIDIRISQTSAVSGDAFYADLFVVTAGDFVPPPGPGNLISNPSFETSLAGWIGWQAVLARESLGDAPDGNYAVKVSHSTGTSFTVNDQPANVSSTTAGQEYIASAWV
ncbi:MAG TPA: carbohydrate binding domain-containing protein, partial [Cyclobacteriaceae bacterium]|nr:carbohydrate binding domain-containing protein [Cyclobacteriaceae bacterium]